ncbi:MAG: aspartate--tRNA ligase [Acidimicrobiia bacterium]|nr:aspartate--tRNA ligase [Acidimicrobiia bacterium]
MMRTHTCGELRASDAGAQAVVCGWVETVRDHGGVLFVDVRDHTGMVQVVAHPEEAPDAFAVAEKARAEYVLRVHGEVRPRPDGTVNPDLPTGEVEIGVAGIEILARSEPLPFQLDESVVTDEGLRLRYRPLDLRRPRLQHTLRLRARVTAAARAALEAEGFVEVETPTLIRSTPEGARDFVVPSRLSPGEWYALPQSPQLYKQLLMVAGVDRYFQFARCWRDEDLRADRQPEFTQLDLEASFAEEEDVLTWVEAAVAAAFAAAGRGWEIELPLPRMAWQEAIDAYGSDKPDLRAGPAIVDISRVFAATEFNAFASTLEAGGAVRAWRLPRGGDRTRSQLDALVERAQELGAKGLVWMVVEEDGSLRSPVVKFLTEAEQDGIKTALEAEPGDLVLLAADLARLASHVLGQLRVELAAPRGHGADSGVAALWVVDFPLFEEGGDGGPAPAHHPFTHPNVEDLDRLESDPLSVRSRSYDLVANGLELGSGSVRIHTADVQERVFRILGLSEEDIHSRFGFLLDAFRYGVPPHAGFAVGWDRLVMILADEASIREVIAFPKTQTGADPLSGAPAALDAGQLGEVGVMLTPETTVRLTELEERRGRPHG